MSERILDLFKSGELRRPGRLNWKMWCAQVAEYMERDLGASVRLANAYVRWVDSSRRCHVRDTPEEKELACAAAEWRRHDGCSARDGNGSGNGSENEPSQSSQAAGSDDGATDGD